MSRQKASNRFRFVAASVLLAGLVFVIPALRSGNSLLYFLAVLIPCVMFLFETVFARMFSLDRMIVALVLWLCAAGISSLAVSDPDAALAHSMCCGAALIALLIGGIMIRSLSPSMLTSACTGFLGLLFLAGKLLPSVRDLPMTEAALAFLLIAFAALFARQGPVSALLLGAVALALMLFSRDLPGAVFWGLTVLLLTFAADGRLVILFPALAVVLLLFLGVYFLYPLQDVSGSSSPLSMLVSIPAVGTDVLPEGLAASDPDSLFLFMAGHWGLVFSGLTALLFLPLALRGCSVAVAARTRFHAMLAMGVTLLISLRALAGVLSVFGLLPVSGLRLPFLTRSLPDLCSEFFLVGLLCGVSGRNDADLAEDAHLAMLAK